MNEQLDEKLAKGVRAVSPTMKTAGDFLRFLVADCSGTAVLIPQPTRPWCQRKTQNAGMPVFFLAVILTAADRNS